MKWNKPYQLMRVIKKSPSQTEYETVMDGMSLASLMQIAGQLLQGALSENVKQEEELEIWKQEESMLMVVAKYFVHNPNFKP